MKKTSVIIAIFFFAAINAFSSEPNNMEKVKEPNDVSVHEVTGHGRNRDEAVKNGLYIAVSQARGVEIGSGNYQFGYTGVGVDVNHSGTGDKKIDFDAVSVETSGTINTTEIRGMVKTYNILEENKLNDSSFDVKLKVWVYSLAGRSKSQRLKIAIMPFKAMANTYRFLLTEIPAENLSDILSQKIAASLVRANKFNILDRESVIDFARERHILLALNSPLSEQSKLAETLGADYLLIGTISDAKIERRNEYVAAIGQPVQKCIGRFVFNYRLVVSATKEIIFAGTAEKYLENDEISALSHQWNPENWDPAELRDGMATIIANEVTKTIIERIYPMRVVSVEGRQVIINQGEDKVKEGMLVDVFREGKEIFDYDTKESLGKDEEFIAMLRITRVSQNFSFGEVVDGDISKITKGNVCRIKEVDEDSNPGMKPDVKRTPNGGIILPFDKK